jgi:thiol:disulfide interchange protein
MHKRNPPRPSRKKSAGLSRILVLVGVVILVAVVFLVKNQSSQTPAPTNSSPEVQLEQYLEEGKPVFAFFHSNNCHSCIVMMDTVERVFPEFEGAVGLVDVNVYDPQNAALLRRAGISSIPTQVFIDCHGEATGSIGVMETEALREQLILLKETP